MNSERQKMVHCEICMTDNPLDEMITLGCSHRFCKGCLVDEWSYKINTEKKCDESDIKCPENECNKPIDILILKGKTIKKKKLFEYRKNF